VSMLMKTDERVAGAERGRVLADHVDGAQGLGVSDSSNPVALLTHLSRTIESVPLKPWCSH